MITRLKDKESGPWGVDFRWKHIEGPRAGTRQRFRLQAPINTKRGAEDFERLLRSRLAAGLTLDGTDPNARVVPLFGDFVEEFMRSYVAASNKPSEAESKRYILRGHLLPRFADTKLDQIGRHEIEQLRAACRAAGCGPKRINNVVGCLLKVLSYAHELELISSVPKVKALKFLRPKLDFLSFAEYARLAEATADTPAINAMIRLGAEAGLRRGEIAAFQLGDVDFERRTLTVRRTAWFDGHMVLHVDSPKSGRERVVDMTRSLTEALRAVEPTRGSYMFPRRAGGPMTPKQQGALLHRACERAGLRRIGWHALRHTFCSQLAMSGADAKTIQEYAGHATLAVTLRYMHLSPGHKREAIERLDRARADRSGHHTGTDFAAHA